MKISTNCVHGKGSRNETGAISTPIYQSATFCHSEDGETTGYDYSRLQNPTRKKLEDTINLLENGAGAIAYSSGMAAIDALIQLFNPGDHIIVSDDIYGGTHRIFNSIASKNLMSFDFVDTSDINGIQKKIRTETKAIFIETPTNPMMKVSDISAITQLVKGKNILVIVDNTFLSPYFQRPLDLGADIVTHSGTKFLGGHNDTLAGFLVYGNHEIGEKLRFISKTTGACLAPFDSWLIMRGIKTLPLRMEKAQENAIHIANWLKSHPKVKKVYYVGLENHPGYQISLKQSSGFGSMISFEVDSQETAVSILKKINLILFAESLGGVESLITYPMKQTHGDIPVEIREAQGINDRLLRMSVGIEDVNDLIEDLKQAL